MATRATVRSYGESVYLELTRDGHIITALVLDTDDARTLGQTLVRHANHPRDITPQDVIGL